MNIFNAFHLVFRDSERVTNELDVGFERVTNALDVVSEGVKNVLDVVA